MRIEKKGDEVFALHGPQGEVVVDDTRGYRSYYIDNPVPDQLALALSLLGVDITHRSFSVTERAARRESAGYYIMLAFNDRKLAIHLKSGSRTRIEQLFDEVFGIPETHWRKA
jgi:hypothetical protein